ncbi:hypothetical protein SBV1_3480004 [Verrucomicrobia bacterium]|nr:hypothetical protein SBV1_3480004 [Verrucomicrobiota bacterium]
MRTVVSLPPQDAAEVVKLLDQEHIFCEARIADGGSGLETTELLVRDDEYDRACDAIENWQAAIAAERHQRLTRRCPKCRSQDWEKVEDAHYANANLTVLRCKACGCMIPG